MARLAALAYRCAIVGPDGSGKTTLLEEIGSRLADKFEPKSLALTLDNRKFPAASFFSGLGPAHVILFDGADLLTSADWHRFKRKASKAGGLIITSHRTGLLPTLIECRTSAKLLAELAHALAGAVDLPVQELYTRHRGNLRDALRELYDVYSRK